MFGKEAIEFASKILKLMKTRTFDIKGAQFSNEQLYPMPAPNYLEPSYPTVECGTLVGFCEFAGSYVHGAGFPFEGINFIRCESDQVDACSYPTGVGRSRHTIIRARHRSPAFRLGCYLPVEEFRISLIQSFVYDEELGNLISLLSKIGSESALTLSDDGIAQSVAIKKGVATYGEGATSPIVSLRMMRSFPEVVQVAAPFLFRLKKDTAGNINAALFEIASGWMREQAEIVADFVRGEFGDSSPTIIV